MIGQTLDGRYKIIQELGSGGFGETFVAVDTKLHGSYCVVKKLKPFAEDKETLKIARRLFELESKTLLRLDHSQIPRLLAYFEQNKNFFLVQELVQGHPLNQEIRAGEPWAVDTILHFLASALKPLAHAHTKDVIHRDIKPANLMRRHTDGEVILIDFGAVKEVRNSSRHGQAQAVNTIPIGTPGYMPDEQSKCQPKFSSDIYALGVTCIEALTGRSATELEEDPQTFEISWRHLVNIDPRLADILDKMVCYDFRQRYASGGEALAALQDYIEYFSPHILLPSPYSPPSEFKNIYIYNFDEKPTKKVSIASKISRVFQLPIITIAKIKLFLQTHIKVGHLTTELTIRVQLWFDIFYVYLLYIGLPIISVVVGWQFHYWFWKFFSTAPLLLSVPLELFATMLIIYSCSEPILMRYPKLVRKTINYRLVNRLSYLFVKPFLEQDMVVYLMSFMTIPMFSAVSVWGVLSLVITGQLLWIYGLYILVFYFGLNIFDGVLAPFSNGWKNLLWCFGNGSTFFLSNFIVWNIASNIFHLKIIDSPHGNPFASISIGQWLLLTIGHFIVYIAIRSLLVSRLIDLPPRQQNMKY
jgi:serine/threonine protein kinase